MVAPYTNDFMPIPQNKERSESDYGVKNDKKLFPFSAYSGFRAEWTSGYAT
jgi:hypothetical protein